MDKVDRIIEHIFLFDNCMMLFFETRLPKLP
jgi:hypothetical protein